MKIAQLPIWTHDVEDGVTLGQKIPGQTGAVKAGALDAKGFNTSQFCRPRYQVATPVTRGRICPGTQEGTLDVDRDGNVIGFVRTNADDDLVHVSPLAKMSTGIDRSLQAV